MTVTRVPSVVTSTEEQRWSTMLSPRPLRAGGSSGLQSSRSGIVGSSDRLVTVITTDSGTVTGSDRAGAAPGRIHERHRRRVDPDVTIEAAPGPRLCEVDRGANVEFATDANLVRIGYDVEAQRRWWIGR